MSNSGFSNISSPARPASQPGPGRGGQIINIVSIPAGLQNTARAVRLEGQITQSNLDGTVRISTPEGNIEAQVRGNKQPQVGQKIEIDLPAGRQPRQATIREQSVQAQNNQGTPARPTSQQIQTPAQQNTSSAQTIENAARNTPTRNVPPAVQEAISQRTSIITEGGAPARPVTTESTLRLLPLPATQAQTITSTYLQNLPPPQQNLVAPVAFAANLVAQSATDLLQQALLQTRPIVQNTAANPLQQPLLQTAPITQGLPTQSLQSFAQPTLNNNILTLSPSQTSNVTQNILLTTPGQSAPQATALQQFTLTPQTPVNTTLIPAQITLTEASNVPLNNIGNATAITKAVTPQTISAIPIQFDPASADNTVLRPAQQIDISVVKILPPETTLKAVPTSTPSATTIPTATTPTIPIPTTTPIAPPPLLSSTTPAAALPAQVVGFAPNNLPIISLQWPGQSQPQSFVLQFNSSNLQLGSQLQVIPRIPANAAPLIATPVQQNTLTNPLLQGFQWPVMDELYNSLLQISPQAASSLSRALPNAGTPTQIAPAAMMFIAAIQSGDVGAWLGDRKTELLQRLERSNLLSRLNLGGGEATARATADPATAGEWRAVPLPMFWENEIHRITLYTKREQNESQQEDDQNNQTRFLFDLSLSRIGDVQLDGLLKDKRLDLIVRTENTFSAPMQQTMRQAYSSALGSTELTGELNFQGSTKNWVHVLQEQEKLGVHV